MRNRHRYEAGQGLRGIDIDWIEYCEKCKRPVLIYELVNRDLHKNHKVWVATQRLAASSGALAGLVEYQTLEGQIICIQATVVALSAHGVINDEKIVVGWDEQPQAWHSWCHDQLLPYHLRDCGVVPIAA